MILVTYQYQLVRSLTAVSAPLLINYYYFLGFIVGFKRVLLHLK